MYAMISSNDWMFGVSLVFLIWWARGQVVPWQQGSEMEQTSSLNRSLVDLGWFIRIKNPAIAVRVELFLALNDTENCQSLNNQWIPFKVTSQHCLKNILKTFFIDFRITTEDFGPVWVEHTPEASPYKPLVPVPIICNTLLQPDGTLVTKFYELAQLVPSYLWPSCSGGGYSLANLLLGSKIIFGQK